MNSRIYSSILSLLLISNKLLKCSPTIELVNDKNAVLLRNEIERLKEEIRNKTQDCATVYKELNNLNEKYQKEKNGKIKKEKLYQTKISQLNNQLIGAVRRINYLVEEKRKAIQIENNKEIYINNLEMELNKDKEQMSVLLNNKSNISQNISDSIATQKEEIRTLKEQSVESIKSIDKEIIKAKKDLEKINS